MKRSRKNIFYPKIGKGKYGSVNPESDEGGSAPPRGGGGLSFGRVPRRRKLKDKTDVELFDLVK